MYKSLFYSCPEETAWNRRGGVGGKTFFLWRGGAYDYDDEEKVVSKPKFPVSEANIFVSEASKLSAGARIFRGPKGPEILVKYKGGIPN